MQGRPPDFYLTTAGEYHPLTEPRACWTSRRLQDDIREDYMLIEFDPPLIGQSFGLGDKDIDQVLIATRLQGFSLYPPTEWPIPVYVIRILESAIAAAGRFGKEQVELIAWGMLFRTREEARMYAVSMT